MMVKARNSTAFMMFSSANAFTVLLCAHVYPGIGHDNPDKTNVLESGGTATR